MMFDSTSTRSSPHLIEHPAPTPLYHPKPVSFARPAFTSSYSTPAFSSSSASPPSPPPTGAMYSSSSCSPSPPSPHIKPSHTLSAKHRPKIKKTSSTTTNKSKSVQVSLEVKVERSRGFHAFFVPLARSMPPAPPSSPVFGQSANLDHHSPEASTRQDKTPSEEHWVENVGQNMEIDG